MKSDTETTNEFAEGVSGVLSRLSSVGPPSFKIRIEGGYHDEPNRGWAQIVTARSCWFEERFKTVEAELKKVGKRVDIILPPVQDKRGPLIWCLIQFFFWTSILLYIAVTQGWIKQRWIIITLTISHVVLTLGVNLLVQRFLSKKTLTYNQPRHTGRAALLMSITVMALVLISNAVALLLQNVIFFSYYVIDQFTEGNSRRLNKKAHDDAKALDLNDGNLATAV